MRKQTDLRVTRLEETKRREVFSSELEEGLHRVEKAHMVASQGAEEVGTAEGRKYAEQVLKLRDAFWESAFRWRRSRFGLGIDDVMIDADGNYWLVEYKGGKGKLERNQMEPAWVRAKIKQMRKEGGPLGEFWAEKLETALKEERLYGVALKTRIVGRTPMPTEVIGKWKYTSSKK